MWFVRLSGAHSTALRAGTGLTLYNFYFLIIDYAGNLSLKKDLVWVEFGTQINTAFFRQDKQVFFRPARCTRLALSSKRGFCGSFVPSSTADLVGLRISRTNWMLDGGLGKY
jgi:hypothetical protein